MHIRGTTLALSPHQLIALASRDNPLNAIINIAESLPRTPERPNNPSGRGPPIRKPRQTECGTSRPLLCATADCSLL